MVAVMRMLLSSLVTALALALAAAVVSASAATPVVKVGDNYFVADGPTPTVRVSRGDRVTWRWVGRAPHNVVVTSGPARFSSPVKRSGVWSRTLRRRGTYTIICTIHGADDQSMRLRVR